MRNVKSKYYYHFARKRTQSNNAEEAQVKNNVSLKLLEKMQAPENLQAGMTNLLVPQEHTILFVGRQKRFLFPDRR